MLKRTGLAIGMNMGALWAVSMLLDKFTYEGGIIFLLIAGIIMGILNSCMKPIIKFLSFPLIFFSAGLFLIAINAIVLWILDYILTVLDFTGVDLKIEGTLTYLWAAIIFGVVNWLERWLLKE
ncbi:MAG: phage holin family protein [Candidatus Gracilibacteria bacterium]|jgi:putative membrane protein